jgi:hypothetical protein
VRPFASRAPAHRSIDGALRDGSRPVGGRGAGAGDDAKRTGTSSCPCLVPIQIDGMGARLLPPIRADPDFPSSRCAGTEG